MEVFAFAGTSFSLLLTYTVDPPPAKYNLGNISRSALWRLEMDLTEIDSAGAL